MTPANPKFDLDLLAGQAREDAFARVICHARFEHKSDRACARTGNVCVEFKQNGKPSGIATTEAEWYSIEVLPEVWILIRTEKLKHLARRALKETGAHPVGDNNNEAALVPVKWLVRPLTPVEDERAA